MTDDQDLRLLQELTAAEGPPGFEERIYQVMEEQIKKHTKDLVKDHLGSIVGKVGERGPRIMLAAHLDEVAFMVSEITKEGYLRIKPLGGWWPHVMLSQRVKVMTNKGDLTGVIGSKPPHVLSSDERKKVMDIKDMFVDIGVADKEAAREIGVEVGDPVCPMGELEPLADSKMLLARNWDDRAGCYVALKVLQQLKEMDQANIVYAGATVQEEVGLRGAQTLTNTVEPDIAFALDVGVAEDTPGMKSKEEPLQLGKGPLLGFLDNSMIPHRSLRDLVVEPAREEEIPFQIDVMEGGGTDAGRFHTALQGVPSMVVSVPARYIHSHVAIIHREDLDHAAQLLVKVVTKLDQTTANQIKGFRSF